MVSGLWAGRGEQNGASTLGHHETVAVQPRGHLDPVDDASVDHRYGTFGSRHAGFGLHDGAVGAYVVGFDGGTQTNGGSIHDFFDRGYPAVAFGATGDGCEAPKHQILQGASAGALATKCQCIHGHRTQHGHREEHRERPHVSARKANGAGTGFWKIYGRGKKVRYNKNTMVCVP